jgi:tripartite-type tricarboxylate transporter receptor subunit TctC
MHLKTNSYVIITSCMALLAQPASAQQTASTGSGQAYPSRHVRVIVPYTPRRHYRHGNAHRCAESFQRRRVDNRPSANSILGMASEKRVAIAPEIPTLLWVPAFAGTTVFYIFPHAILR